MIPASKSEAFSAAFGWDVARRLRGSFSAVRVRGLDALAATAALRPVLVVSNHTAWWDALVIFHVINRLLRLDGYALMDAKNLRRLPFFGRIGAFGVDLDDRADGARAVRYAARLLDRPGRLVWIFAQGRERPVTARPLGFHPGAAGVARVAKGAAVFPAALRYEHGEAAKPSLTVSIGPMLSAARDVHAATAEFEAAVLRELEAIDAALCAGASAGFVTLHESSSSSASRLAERALGWLMPLPRSLRPKTDE